MSKLGTTLRKQRLSLGFSQRKLAKLADLSNDYISKIEAGAAENVGILTLKKIAHPLGLSLVELQEGLSDARAVAAKKVRESAPAYGPKDPNWQTLTKIWPSLSPAERKMLVITAKQLAAKRKAGR